MCGCEEYPLLRTINRVLRKYPESGKQCILEENQTKNDAPATKPPTKPTTTTTKEPEFVETRKNQTVATTKRTTTAKLTTTKRTTTTTTPQHELDSDFNDDGGSCVEGQFYKHPSNCEKYYQCVFGSLSERR